MNAGQRATIFILVVATVAVWSLGLRAALRAGARADQGLMADLTLTNASVGATATMAAPPATAPTSLPEAASTTLASTATLAPSPTPVANRPLTPTLSLPATLNNEPLPTPSPTATSTRRPTATPSPTTPATPTIPQTGRFLLVNQDEQMLHIYEDGTEVRIIPISTGRPVANAFTPAWRGKVGPYWGSGPFLNTHLWSDHMWYLFPGARGSILIHSVPYDRDGDVKIYDRLDALGVEPASHGCVRISPQDAEWLQTWDPVGVPIQITPWSGEIGPPDESL